MSKNAFVEEARKFVPDIESADVVKGVRGIRAQALNADGSLVDDFVIRSTGRLVQVRNAPSPGGHSFPRHRRTHRRGSPRASAIGIGNGVYQSPDGPPWL